MKVSQTRARANGWCRLCLCDKVSARPIFADGAAFERLRSLILDCCPVTLIDDDHLPTSICLRCEHKLDIAHQFRQLCRESERVLRARYESIFRERSDTLRVSGAQKDVGQRSKISKCPRDERPRRSSTDRTKSSLESASSASKSLECRVGESLEIVSDHGKDADEIGIEKRTDPAGFRSEKADESESKTGTSKQRRSEEPEEGDRSFRSRKVVREPANETSLPVGDTAATTGTSATDKRYLCDACSKTFASKSGLRFHSKSHIGAKPHPCRHCGKRFAIPSYAKRHERIHAAEKQFICHVCSASFASSNGLRYHLRSHTGEANYRCETCGKSFQRYKYLKEHVFTHTGEKPFVCKSCGVAYASSGSLFVHEKKCGRKPGESSA